MFQTQNVRIKYHTLKQGNKRNGLSFQKDIVWKCLYYWRWSFVYIAHQIYDENVYILS